MITVLIGNSTLLETKPTESEKSPQKKTAVVPLFNNDDVKTANLVSTGRMYGYALPTLVSLSSLLQP